MKKEKGFSLIELLIVVAIIGIIAAIAIPNLLKSRQAANESSAIGSCRTIGTAQATYQSTRGRGKDFAGTAGGGDAFANGLLAEGLVDATLGAGAKSGYNFACNGFYAAAGLPSYFNTRAFPQSVGTFGTGNRSFSSNETFVIYAIDGGVPVDGAAPPGNRAPAGMLPIE